MILDVRRGVLRAAAVREDVDTLEIKPFAVVLDDVIKGLVVEERGALGFREDTPNVGRYDALVVLNARRVGHDEDVHVAPPWVLARARAGSLVVVLSREVGGDAQLVVLEGGVREVALACRPPMW